MTPYLGQILSLVGLVLLVVNSLIRRRGQSGEPAAPVVTWWRRQGDFVAYAFILLGLFLWLK